MKTKLRLKTHLYDGRGKYNIALIIPTKKITTQNITTKNITTKTITIVNQKFNHLFQKYNHFLSR